MPFIINRKDTFTAFDRYIGVSHFWTEKFLLVTNFTQHLALLWVWRLHLPISWLRRSQVLPLVLFDSWSHHQGLQPLIDLSHTLYHDIAVAAFAITLFASWAMLSQKLIQHSVMGNAERCLYILLRLLYLPILYHGVRFAIMQYPLNMDEYQNPTTSATLRFIVFPIVFGIFAIAVPLRLWQIAHQHCLFQASVLYDRYIQAKELQYLMHLNAEYRHTRVYLVSSYRRPKWALNTFFCGFDLVLILIFTFFAGPTTKDGSSEQIGSILVFILFTLRALYFTFTARAYRVRSSATVLHISNWGHVFNTLVMMLQARQIKNPFLVDNTLENFLFGYNLSLYILIAVLSLWWWYECHEIVFMAATDEIRERSYFRSKRNTIRNDDDLGEGDPLMNEPFVVAVRRSQTFHLSQQTQSKWRTINHTKPEARNDLFVRENSYAWPTGVCLLEELYRQNESNHFLDTLWSSQDIIDEINSISCTPELCSAEIIEGQMKKIRSCLEESHRVRLLHHLGMFHPLHHTFQEYLDALAFEHDRINAKTCVQGKKSIRVRYASRFLRERMDARYQWRRLPVSPRCLTRRWVLFSPTANRILLKLFCLRMFVCRYEEVRKRRGKGALPNEMKKIDFDDDDAEKDAPFAGVKLSFKGLAGSASSFRVQETDVSLPVMQAVGNDDPPTDVPSTKNEHYTDVIRPGTLTKAERPSSVPEPTGGLEVERRRLRQEAEIRTRAAIAAIDDEEILERQCIKKELSVDRNTMQEEYKRTLSEIVARKAENERAHSGGLMENDQQAHAEAVAVQKESDDKVPDQESSRAKLSTRKKELQRMLKDWKAEFATVNSRAPKKSDIMKDETIRVIYEEYQRLQELEKEDVTPRSHVDPADEKRESSVSPPPPMQVSSPPPVPQVQERAKELNTHLKRWKAAFAAVNKRDATKSDIKKDNKIRAIYEEYKALKETLDSGPLSEESPSVPLTTTDATTQRIQELNQQLNQWKVDFAATQGRKAEISDMDETIKLVWREYRALTEGGTIPIPTAAPELPKPSFSPPPPSPPPEPIDPVARKQELNKHLKQWKANFATQNGRDAKKSDIIKDDAMRPIYEEYMRIKEQ